MAKRVLLATRDLFFRSKLAGVVAAAGAELIVGEGDCDLAVVELDTRGGEGRIRALVDRGIPVLAFGSHVNAEVLRQARAAGAVAVPNSQVEAKLLALLTGAS